MLGVQPVLGRDFNSEEGRVGGRNVVIVSHRLWQVRFQADRSVLGKTLILDSESYTVIGVLPPEFQLPGFGAENTDLWLPLRVPVTSNNPSNGSLRCLGLLKPGVTPSQAEAALTPPLSELRRQFPNMFGPHERARLQPLRSFIASSGGAVPLLAGAFTPRPNLACA